MSSTYLSFRHHSHPALPPSSSSLLSSSSPSSHTIVKICLRPRQCRRTVLSTPSSSFRQRVSCCHPCRLLHRQPRLHGIVYLLRRVVVSFYLFPCELSFVFSTPSACFLTKLFFIGDVVRDARGDFGQKEVRCLNE